MASNRSALLTAGLMTVGLMGCTTPAEEVVVACDAAGAIADGVADFARGGEPPTPVADTVLQAVDGHDGVRGTIEELNLRVRGIDEDAVQGRDRSREVRSVERALADAEDACNEAGYDVWLLPRM